MMILMSSTFICLNHYYYDFYYHHHHNTKVRTHEESSVSSEVRVYCDRLTVVYARGFRESDWSLMQHLTCCESLKAGVGRVEKGVKVLEE